MQISIFLGLCSSVLGAVDMQPYNQAIRENPKDFMAYYKRATAYLAQNNDAQALRDLSKTLELNPGFEPGLYYHARTNLRLGNSERAKEELQQCDGRCTELLEQCNEYEQLSSAALADLDCSEWGDCITESSQALSIAPKSLKTRRTRYECYMGAGDAAHAFVDLTEIVSQDKGDAEGVSKLAKFEFLINGNQDKAMQLLRRCVNFDPDAKLCTDTSKKLRKLQKELQAPKLQFKKLIKEISSEITELGLPEEEQSALIASLHRKQCELFYKREKWAQGAEVCARVRDVEPDFVPAVLLQAQLERENNNPREAAELLKSLIRDGNKDPRLQQLYQEILMEYQQQQRQQSGGGPSQASGKDLYKVLGVEKSATKKEIKKAYRELSKKFHPDKYKGDDLTKDQIMEKMQEINEAHEILSDDQKRQEYDAERAGGGRAQGGFPGGGGPGGFQFQGGGFPGGGGDMNDILRQFMRQQQQQGRGQQGGFHF